MAEPAAKTPSDAPLDDIPLQMIDHLLPVLYINMAGEMMYILEQRLRNIDQDKCSRVLKEILLCVLNRDNLEKVFKARGLPGKLKLKSLFEKLAHSSIMRLNENSMDKLFDLMTMTTKFEVQQIPMAEQLMTMTVNHLQGIMEVCPKDQEVKEHVEHAYTLVFSLYRSMSSFSWHMIRAGILTYFQEARVKISMLLREERQMSNGEFYLFHDTEPVLLPRDGEAPGTIKYFTSGAITNATEFPIDKSYTPFVPQPDALNVEHRSTKMGMNMYKDANSLKIQGGGGTAKLDQGVRDGNELKLLETLFGEISAVRPEGAMDLSLFDDEGEEATYVKETEAMLGNVLTIDASRNKKSMDTAMAEMKLERAPSAKKSSKSKGANMLEMLDEAAARPPTAKPKKSTSSANAPAPRSRGTTPESRARSASKGPSDRASSAGPKRKGSAKRS